MPNEQQLAVELDEHRPDAHIHVQWSDGKPVEVRVELKGTQGGISWTGEPQNARKPAVLSMLDQIPGSTKGTEFVLKLKSQATGVRVASWDASTEAENLHRARTELELMAHVPYVIAKAALKDAESRSDAEAPGILRTGIDALSNLYADPQLLDDTGMKLVLAESSAKKGDMQMAAGIFRRVLESRISAYSAKYAIN